MQKQESIWNVPNGLTMLRIALIGVFVWLFAADLRYWAMGVFLLAGLTDFLDGYIARKQQLVTSFGKLMDPLADKLMLITALACLTAEGLVPLWIIVVTVCKELLMIIGSFLLLRRRNVVVYAAFIGKAATVVFLIAVVLTFLHEYTRPWDYYTQLLAITLSVASMTWYLTQTLRSIKEEERKEA